MNPWWLLLPFALVVVIIARIVRIWSRRDRSNDLVAASTMIDEGVGERPEPEGGIPAWLVRAGFRRPTDPARFRLIAAIAALLGLAIALGLDRSGVLLTAGAGLEGRIGGIGSLAVYLFMAAPLIIFALIAAAPWVYVRSARRERVRELEAQLPVTFELMASMGEAGLGFDAAIERLASNDEASDVLTEEFSAFRSDMMAGLSRSVALRRLSRRVAVPAMSMFASALIQADRMGTSVSNTLRNQANDLRDRRRQRAQGKAQALPVKLVVPLVICFLPAIFVITLGPAFSQLVRVIDSVTR